MIKLIQSDEIFNTPFISNKSWTLTSDDTIQKLEEGIYVSSSYNFYDTSSNLMYGFPTESKNSDGTYKRLVHQVIKNCYYTDDVSKALGLETLDTDAIIKIMQPTLLRVSIPRNYFGDSIQRDTVVINDYSNDKNYTMLDDTYGNLYIDGTHFINYIETTGSNQTAGLPDDTDTIIGPIVLFGSRVESSGKFVAIGNPHQGSLLPSPLGTGSIDIFRYNISKGLYSYYGKSVFHKGNPPASTFDSYGISFALYNNIFVVGNPYSSGVPNVDVYVLENTSTSASVIEKSLEWGHTTIYGDISWNSFGQSVSINSDYIIISQPFYDSDTGRVLIYKYITGSNNTINISYETNIIADEPGKLFGYLIKINQSGSNSILIGEDTRIGSGLANPNVYLYESSSAGWIKTCTFSSVTGSTLLPFDDIESYNYVKNQYDYFGKSMDIYGDVIVIGAPSDAIYYQYNGSSRFDRGAVYIYNKINCFSESTGSIYYNNSQTNWDLMEKFIGDKNTLLSNQLGYSVDIFNNKILIGCISSSDFPSKTDVSGSLNPSFNDTNAYLGQFLLLEKSGSVINNITYDNKKKLIGYPYLSYGHSVSINDFGIVIGAPLMVTDFAGYDDYTITDLKPKNAMHVKGHAYFGMMDALRTNYHAGNVFYRNGDIIFSNTGSQFTNVLKSDDTGTYNYDINYKGRYTINEKTIICTINPGEFNISTNPTALDVVDPPFDLHNSGNVTFKDINLILLYITDINTPGSPDFSTDDTFWDDFVVETETERSLLNYYKQKYGYDKYTLKMEYSAAYISKLRSMESQFDFNGDGAVDIKDAKILWKYFCNTLNRDVCQRLITPFSSRKTIQDLIQYLTSKISKYSETGGIPTLKPEFLDYTYSSSMDITGSYLAPYITSIGLYSGSDLIAVAKLAYPIKNSGEYPLNFLIKWDV